jgi:hypothetical protein
MTLTLDYIYWKKRENEVRKEQERVKDVIEIKKRKPICMDEIWENILPEKKKGPTVKWIFMKLVIE